MGCDGSLSRLGVRESGDTDPRDRRARRRTSYDEEGVRYAREKIGDVDEEDDGDDDDDGACGEAPTDHLLTFLAPASLVCTSPAVGGSHSGSVRSHGEPTVSAGDADRRGRRDDPRPQPAAPRRRDAVIRPSATGDRGGGSAPPRTIVVVVGDGGICHTVDRGRIVPETTAGNGAS